MAKTLKWLVALLVVVGLLWFLHARSGERPLTRVETAVDINDLK